VKHLWVIRNIPPISKAQWRGCNLYASLVPTLVHCCLGKSASLVVKVHQIILSWYMRMDAYMYAYTKQSLPQGLTTNLVVPWCTQLSLSWKHLVTTPVRRRLQISRCSRITPLFWNIHIIFLTDMQFPRTHTHTQKNPNQTPKLILKAIYAGYGCNEFGSQTLKPSAFSFGGKGLVNNPTKTKRRRVWEPT